MSFWQHIFCLYAFWISLICFTLFELSFMSFTSYSLRVAPTLLDWTRSKTQTRRTDKKLTDFVTCLPFFFFSSLTVRTYCLKNHRNSHWKDSGKAIAEAKIQSCVDMCKWTVCYYELICIFIKWKQLRKRGQLNTQTSKWKLSRLRPSVEKMHLI